MNDSFSSRYGPKRVLRGRRLCRHSVTRSQGHEGWPKGKRRYEMKLLTIFELAAKPERELRALYREAFNAAARADRTSVLSG